MTPDSGKHRAADASIRPAYLTRDPQTFMPRRA